MHLGHLALSCNVGQVFNEEPQCVVVEGGQCLYQTPHNFDLFLPLTVLNAGDKIMVQICGKKVQKVNQNLLLTNYNDINYSTKNV